MLTPGSKENGSEENCPPSLVGLSMPLGLCHLHGNLLKVGWLELPHYLLAPQC